MHKDSVFSS